MAKEWLAGAPAALDEMERDLAPTRTEAFKETMVRLKDLEKKAKTDTGASAMIWAKCVDLKAGKLEFRTDKQGIVHVPFGKCDFEEDKLTENLLALSATIDKLDAARSWLCRDGGQIVTVPQAVPPQIDILQTDNRIPWSGHMARHALPALGGLPGAQCDARYPRAAARLVAAV